jgi:hypothetical protein
MERISWLARPHGIRCGSKVQTVTLAYTLGGSQSRSFPVYSANIVDVEFERKLVKTLAGGYIEQPVGYRYLMSVDFAPRQVLTYALMDDAYWLYGFRLGADKTLTFQKSFQDAGETMRNVIPVGDRLEYTYINGVSFAAGFTMTFYETGLRTITDTGVDFTIQPYYEPGYDTITTDSAGNKTWARSVNLVDDCTSEFETKELKFINGNHDAPCYGYRHRFRVDFGPIVDITKQDALIQYCLWEKKYLNTGGTLYSVVLEDMELRWTFENGMREILSASLTFIENTLRTTPEVYYS